jgi:hypothetical protein
LVEPEDLVKMVAIKKDCEVLASEPLKQIGVMVTQLNHNVVFDLGVMPKSGAMIKAIPIKDVKVKPSSVQR